MTVSYDDKYREVPGMNVTTHQLLQGMNLLANAIARCSTPIVNVDGAGIPDHQVRLKLCDELHKINLEFITRAKHSAVAFIEVKPPESEA